MITFRSLTKERIFKKVLQKLAEKAVPKNKELSVLVVGPARMSSLNKSYRKEDYAANVLSFAGEGPELGEVVLCPAIIRKDAKKYGITYQRALKWMLIHGILHLLGYDHTTLAKEQKMKNKEEFYLS